MSLCLSMVYVRPSFSFSFSLLLLLFSVPSNIFQLIFNSFLLLVKGWLCNEKMESSHFTSGRCEGLQFAAFNTIEEALADKEAKKKERERQQALQAAQEAEAAAQAERRAVMTCSHCSVVFPSETALSAHQVTCSPSESSSSSSSSSSASSAPSVFVCRRCSASGFASALAHFLHESTCNATIHPSRQVRRCRRFIR